VLSIKTCLEGGNLVNLTIHAPWYFIKPHAKYKNGGGSHGFVLQEYHGGMWGKGVWKWVKAKTLSGRNNNASKGVDENVGRCTWSRSKSVLEKNRDKRRREVSLPSSSLFLFVRVL
jgi:hypothetical protein